MATINPTFTFATAGNVRASASLAASATDNANVDWSAVMGARLTVKVTPGGTVSATHDIRVDIFNRYGSGPATSVEAYLSWTIGGLVASTVKDPSFDIPPGQYNVKFTNLDASQGVTLEATADTFELTVT